MTSGARDKTKDGDLALLILAAGEGTRMKSSLPKVLHPVCGRSILAHQIAVGRELGAARIVVVVGEDRSAIEGALADTDVLFCEQRERLGTAHAVLQAHGLLADHAGPVLVMYGDHPCYRSETLAAMVNRYRESDAVIALSTVIFPDPASYGRIVRAPDGELERIVEVRDATDEIRAIREVNLGNFVATAESLFDAVSRVRNENDQREYYLTDVVELALRDGHGVEAVLVDDWEEAVGVNTRADLAQAEAIMRRRIAQGWMLEGVTLVDPDHTYIDTDVEIGQDTWIEPGVRLRGATKIGPGCRLEAGVVIDTSELREDVWVKPQCWIEESRAGRGCIIGPSAHLRPGSELAEDVRIGNFVEVKNSRIGTGTKADHLSYIGDADVGEGVTFACGAITVNYDGIEKSRTVVGDGAFVGCNSNLLAPVTVEAGAFVAAGSTISKDVPGGALSVARARQRDIEGWVERRRRRVEGSVKPDRDEE